VTATPTRTLNPLPFGDLEPHRFEDLVRQLAYDLRQWKSVEATGRSGSDDGIDIRAVEVVPASPPHERDSDQESDETGDAETVERTWIFQCKREKALPPNRVRSAVAESLPAGAPPPHGFVLAAACDVSKKARDIFRAEMVHRGVEEFHIWARGELEDQLFQPKNDGLLFAYFGLSLQPRRRSQVTVLRSGITLKKQLRSLFEADDAPDDAYLLLRNINETYPQPSKLLLAGRHWVLCKFLHLRDPAHVAVLVREHLAWVSEATGKWDYVKDPDLAATSAYSYLESKGSWLERSRAERRSSAYDFFNEYVPSDE